jgi:hypothetical protein
MKYVLHGTFAKKKEHPTVAESIYLVVVVLYLPSSLQDWIPSLAWLHGGRPGLEIVCLRLHLFCSAPLTKNIEA